MEVYETIEAGIYRLEIVSSDNPSNPRGWDNLGTIVCWHPRYALGDFQIKGPQGNGSVEHRFAAENFESLEDLEAYLVNEEKAVVVLPLTLYDHSLISLHVARRNLPFDPGNWDSTFVGFIYTTKARVIELCGKGAKYQRAAWLEKELRREIEVYNQYLSGDVWGYVLKDAASDEVLDSCYDFFGSDPTKNGMLENMDDDKARKAIEDALAGKTHALRHFIVYHVEQLAVLGTSADEVRSRYTAQNYDVRSVEEISEEEYATRRKRKRW